MKKLTLVTALLALLTLSACHTVQGVGTDIQRGGQVIQKAAQ